MTFVNGENVLPWPLPVQRFRGSAGSEPRAAERQGMASPSKIRRLGMGVHQSPSMLTDEWLTPPDIIKALGPFDLAPCSPSVRPWPTAMTHYSLPQDGLSLPWHGRIWLNPPYGKEMGRWLEKLADHGDGIALIFARTDAAMFTECVWEKADAVLFIRRRLTFHHSHGSKTDNSGGAPSCVLQLYGWRALANHASKREIIFIGPIQSRMNPDASRHHTPSRGESTRLPRKELSARWHVVSCWRWTTAVGCSPNGKCMSRERKEVVTHAAETCREGRPDR